MNGLCVAIRCGVKALQVEGVNILACNRQCCSKALPQPQILRPAAAAAAVRQKPSPTCQLCANALILPACCVCAAAAALSMSFFTPLAHQISVRPSGGSPP
jgi:hypothetical protein